MDTLNEKRRFGLSSAGLHILAMAIMLGDHLWATMLPWMEWLTCLGRVAFPIFAFMTVEGYFHTHDVKKYLLRMLIFAILSEVPFDFIMGSTAFDPFDQNVLWVFLFGLLLICMVEAAKKKGKLWLTVLASVGSVVLGYAIGTFGMLDYQQIGILTVLAFYFFHGRKWWCFLGQAVCLGYFNFVVLATYCYTVTIGGLTFDFPQQGFALLALLPIWLYNGTRGYHKKWFQYFCYAFYPAHLMILYLIWHTWA